MTAEELATLETGADCGGSQVAWIQSEVTPSAVAFNLLLRVTLGDVVRNCDKPRIGALFFAES